MSQNVAPFERTNAAHSKGPGRHAMSWNVGMTQPVATGTMIVPLTLTVNGTSGAIGVFGTTDCAPPSGPNPCPNINFTASPPQYYSSLDVPMALSAATLNAACAAPSGSPTPAPGFTAACYVVTYEGGAGPYVLQGPVTGSAGALSVPAETSTIYFQGLTPYNLFLAYVTDIASPPPAITPSPVPSPTDFATPTPVPTATTCGSVGDDVRTMDDDGDDGGTCATPTPQPTPACGDDDGEGGHHHHHHKRHKRHTRSRHHRGDDDCED